MEDSDHPVEEDDGDAREQMDGDGIDDINVHRKLRYVDHTCVDLRTDDNHHKNADVY